MEESRREGQSEEAEKGRGEEAERGMEAAVERDERRFFADLGIEAKAVREKTSERLFGDARGFVRELSPEAAKELRPFLEKAGAASDVKIAEEAKLALARLELGKI
jgi:hypothetical protein